MKLVNGQTVPENLSVQQIESMMLSQDMQTFALACEALRLTGTQDAYTLLKMYIHSTDPYRRRYVLSVIFDFPQASELTAELEAAMKSGTPFLVTTALEQLRAGKAWASEEAILSCFERKHNHLDGSFYSVLSRIQKSPDHCQRILELYSGSRNSSTKIALAECLLAFADVRNYESLYTLFRNDPAPHIRILACRLAKDYQREDWLSSFYTDPDGHIRKLACAR